MATATKDTTAAEEAIKDKIADVKQKEDDSTSNGTNSKKRPRSDTAGFDEETATANATGTDSGKSASGEKNESGYGTSVAKASAPALQPLLAESLGDLLDGIPRKEMQMIVSEAKECEISLEKEIQDLKEALEQEIQAKQKGTKEEEKATETTKSADKDPVASSVSIMLESEVTPPDHYWTVSSLLGRLRHDLTTPLPPNSQIQILRDKAGVLSVAPPPFQKKRKSNAGTATPTFDATNSGRNTPSGRSTPINNGVNADLSQFERLKHVRAHPDYIVQHENSDRLFAVWKKISTHRSSIVFRRAVNNKDAPGYSDRIHFPMDLSLIRKLIMNGTIKSYADIAKRIHLIAHNCVKYNGRESDYALVSREFESYAAEFLMNATYSHSNPAVVVPNPVGRPSKKRTETPTAAAADATTSTNHRNEVAKQAGINQQQGHSGVTTSK
ncbi:MAG: hypothetical protein SGILL_006409 [Bacillariaceae sp.]